jgi:hypothetical protein
MTATADKAVTAGSETLIPASSRESLLVGEEHQIDGRGAVERARRADPDAINQRLRSTGAEELPAVGSCGGHDDAGRQPVAGRTSGQRC